MDNIVYTTGLGGEDNLLEIKRLKEREYDLDAEWEFRDPISLDYEYYDDTYDDTLDCGCCSCCGCSCDEVLLNRAKNKDKSVEVEFKDGSCEEFIFSLVLTDEDLQLYDDNCEEYEERKRKRIAEEQEY